MTILESNKLASMALMAADCATIRSLMEHENGPNFWLCCMPYYSLYCAGIEECFQGMGTDQLMDDHIKNIRNTLKLMQHKGSKIYREILAEDRKQNEQFQIWNFLIYKIYKHDCNSNLSIFFDNSCRMISNTQMQQYQMQVEDIYSREAKQQFDNYNQYLKELIDACYREFLKLYPFPDLPIKSNPITAYYLDLNTNSETELYGTGVKKEIALQMMYILCSLNFVKHMLLPILPPNNLWGFRIKYITAYYASFGMEKLSKKIKSECNNSRLKKGLQNFSPIHKKTFNAEVRKCMMHYDLAYNETPAINVECYDEKKPFFGLIESHYDGMSLEEVSSQIDQEIDQMIGVLTPHFTLNRGRLRLCKELLIK